MKKCIFYLFIITQFFLSTHLIADKKEIYFKSYDNLDAISCKTKENCITLDFMIKRLQEESFLTRKSLKQLYKYGQYVKLKVGNLIPHFNFNVISGAINLDPAVLFSSCGFILPSNWFQWKESKLQYLSQRYSMINLLANQIRMGEILYYNLHREINASYIYKHYSKILNSILSYMKENPLNNINDGDIAIIEALKADMNVTSLFIQDTIADLLPKLGYELALDIDKDWEKIELDEQALPNLNKKKHVNINNNIEKAWANSDNLKSMYYMIQAAKYTLKTRYFDWMSPFAMPENGLGMSLPAQIKITKNQAEIIKIKYEEEKSNIKYNIYSAIGVHNTAIEGFKESTKGRKAIKKLMDHVIMQITEGDSFDVHQLYEGIILAVEFDMLRNFAQHLYLITKSQIKRLLKDSKEYKNIANKLPKYHKNDNKHFLFKLENHRIKHAIKNEKIKFLGDDYKLFYYSL